MATMWKVYGNAVKAADTAGWAWARYDANGARIETPDGRFGREREVPTPEQLATWDAEAPAKAPAALAERAAEQAHAARLERVGAIKARYDGVCSVTGRRFRRGDLIARDGDRGWALASALVAAPVPAWGGEFAGDDADGAASDARIARAELAAESAL